MKTMEGNIGYKEWVEDMGNICPNCESKEFDIIHRKCLVCDYELNHNTLSIILPIKKEIDLNIDYFNDPYDSIEKGFEDDKKYFKR